MSKKNTRLLAKPAILSLVAISVLLLVSPIAVLADSVVSNRACLDSSTLNLNSTLNVTSNSNVTITFTDQNVTCPYGCFSGQCVPPTLITETTFLIVIGVAVSFLIIGYRGSLMPFIALSGIMFLLLAGTIFVDGIQIDGVLYVTTTQNLDLFVSGIATILLGLSLYIITTALYAYRNGKQ